MPLAIRFGVVPLIGDLHNHCGISYGHGSLEDALTNAQRQLDFVSITGHASWPDMPVGEPSVSHIVDFHEMGFARLAAGWPEHFVTLSTFEQPGAFSVFPGYEIHSSAHGDYTIVLRDLTASELILSDSPGALLKDLRATFGDSAFAFPHHIAYRTGARGISWDSFIEELSPVLEVVSMHGSSETSLTDRPFLHSMGPGDGHNTVHHGWNSGRLFGVLGNTDHHSGYPGSYGHGRSAVYAPENSRVAIWSALHQRQTVALSGDNIHVFTALNGAMQGGVIEPTSEATLDLEVVGGSFIDTIDVIKNGALLHRISPELDPRPIGSSDNLETIMVLELGWGARGSWHDWEGSVRVRGGTLDAIEPRLRGPEVVSPLEAGEHDAPVPTQIMQRESGYDFELRAYANPNNATQAMQTIAARVQLTHDAVLEFSLSGKHFEIPASRLLSGAVSGNLGLIDTPAFRVHPLPRPHEWQWQGAKPIGPLEAGDWVNVRVRQKNGQFAISSPIFCR